MALLARTDEVLRRIRRGLNRAGNWWQLVRFCLVGGSCYLVNVGTFVVAVELLELHYLAGAVLAYSVAVTSSFFGHRVVTFRARGERVPSQARRFVLVHLASSVVGTGLLQLGISGGLPGVAAQAVAAGIAAPLSFTASKMWSFAPLWLPAEPSEAQLRH